MAAHNVDGKRLFFQELSNNSTNPFVRQNESTGQVTTRTIPVPQPSSASASTTTNQSFHTLTTRTEVTPKTRIVVVRTTPTTQNEKEKEVVETNEPDRSKSVELPPLITNGHTSVYLIRRPIPPEEPPKPTLFFKPEEFDDTAIKTITTTTTTTRNSRDGNDFQDPRTPSPLENTTISPDPRERRDESSSRRSKAQKRRRFFARSDSPTVDSNENPLSRSSTMNESESPTHLLSSPTQDSFQHTPRHRSRSRSKSRRRRDPSQSDSKRRKRSTSRRISPTDQSISSQPVQIITEEDSKKINRKRSFFSFSQTKSTGVQANLSPPEPISKEQRAIQTTRPILTRKTLLKKSSKSRRKSAKAIVLVNPEDQTIAVVENTYLRGKTIKPIVKEQHQKSTKQTRFEEDIKDESLVTEEFVDTSRWHRCVGCLSRHMCLILTICLILLLIGLAGVGVSAYFLATDSQDNFIPTVVGIAVGAVLALVSLCILYCILGCIGSREGYFTYNKNGPHIGGQVYAMIPPTHPNADHYIPCDSNQVQEHKKSLVSVTSYSTSPTFHKERSSASRLTSSKSINRQVKIVNESNGITSAKNVTIEMPERLLAGRKMSPKTHERKLNQVVTNIGQVVNNTKNRYNGDMPTKVIVKIDDSAENIKTIA